MAALNQERFTPATDDTIEELRNGAKNVSTSKSTSFWLSVWKTWCEGKGIALEIEGHEPAELKRLLEKFYAEVKNKNSEDYVPDSLRVMIAAFDRHLKDKQYPLSIVRDREFHSSKQVLEGKAKLLRQAGRGKRPNKARNLTKEEEELLWKENKFGSTTPEALVNTMWWLLTQHFGLRGQQEHHDMKVDDLTSSYAKMTMTWSSYSSLKGRPKPDKEVCAQSTAIFIHECLPLVEKDAQWLFLSSL
ncbi:uncharacterized protein KIAA1958-like [Acropora palmata]|uniref:uncharacterized protein KIAA1958-like n=1 Tax=Acropora palmata TaxID=6131 RepID=UPI003DA00061